MWDTWREAIFPPWIVLCIFSIKRENWPQWFLKWLSWTHICNTEFTKNSLLIISCGDWLITQYWKFHVEGTDITNLIISITYFLSCCLVLIIWHWFFHKRHPMQEAEEVITAHRPLVSHNGTLDTKFRVGSVIHSPCPGCQLVPKNDITVCDVITSLNCVLPWV